MCGLVFIDFISNAIMVSIKFVLVLLLAFEFHSEWQDNAEIGFS